MRKLLFCFVIWFLACSSFGQQILKLRATDFCYQIYNEYYGYWNDWSSWTETNILIVMNLATDRINIYSDDPQEYDIIQTLEDRVNSDGDYIWIGMAIDEDGIRCRVKVIFYYGGENHLIISYSDMK